jgi:hypothetical protein
MEVILLILCLYSIITYTIAIILVASTYNYKYEKEREVVEAFILITLSPIILPILLVLAVIQIIKEKKNVSN